MGKRYYSESIIMRDGFVCCIALQQRITISVSRQDGIGSFIRMVLVFAKKKNIPKIRDYYGSGSRFYSGFFWGKSSQNSSKPVLICWSSRAYTMCTLFVYTLLKL